MIITDSSRTYLITKLFAKDSFIIDFAILSHKCNITKLSATMNTNIWYLLIIYMLLTIEVIRLDRQNNSRSGYSYATW